jgi:hypothetical protein
MSQTTSCLILDGAGFSINGDLEDARLAVAAVKPEDVTYNNSIIKTPPFPLGDTPH